MKKWLIPVFFAFLIISCGSSIFAEMCKEDEDIELRVWKLKQELRIEEDLFGRLKKRYKLILKKKYRMQRVIATEKQRAVQIEKIGQEGQKYTSTERQKAMELQLFLSEVLVSKRFNRNKN